MQEKKVKNKELAEHMGISVSSVGYWLVGKRKPSDNNIDKLCNYFGINRIDLMNEQSEYIDFLNEPVGTD